MDHPPAASPDLLAALRAETGPAHAELEQMVDIPRRVADPARYAGLLQDFLGFYRPLERRLSSLGGWDETGLNLAARSKTPWLEGDLATLGLSPAAIAALPDCTTLPPTATLDHGCGCLYVLEGATLGGRQITSLLRGSAIPEAARRFFNSYGADTGARWREFLGALDRRGRAAGAAGRAEIVLAARETFACLQAWIVRE